MKRRDLLIALATSGALYSQAAPRGEFVGVDPKQLTKVSPAVHVRLNESLAWSREGNGTELGLLPGDYECQANDADAKFFVGREATCYVRTVRGDYLVAPGGLWLPDAAELAPRFFIVQRPNSLRRGPTLATATAATPAQPVLYPPGMAVVDALLQWASDGQMMLLAEINDAALVAKIRAAFAVT